MRHPQGQGVQHLAITLMCLLAFVLDSPFLPLPANSRTPVSFLSVMFSCFSYHCNFSYRAFSRAKRQHGVKEDIQLGVLKNQILSLFLPLALLCNAE